MLSFRFDIFTFFHDTGPVASDQHQWPYFQHVLVTGPVPDVADVLRSDASESQRHENTVHLSRKRFKRLGVQSPALSLCQSPVAVFSHRRLEIRYMRVSEA
jgi:hypothetical protein